MKVPVRRLPDTRVSERQLGYSRAAPALDFSPITDSIKGLHKQIMDGQRERQRFDLNRRFISEVNELQADFERRKRDPSISPYTFADTIDRTYAERHESLMNSLWDEGFDRDLLEEHATRLGSVRQGFFENGLGHQLGALRVRALDEGRQLGLAHSQYVAANPDGYASSEAELRETIGAMPDLTEQERTDLIEEQLAIIRNGGGKAIAMQNPGLVIEMFDPQGLTAPISVQSAPGGAYQVIEGLDDERSQVASTLSTAMPPQVVAGFLGNFDVEGGYGGAQGDGGTASGIAQWRLDRRANFRSMFGKEPHTATPAEQAQFVVWEMENPGKAGMTVAQRDAILSADTPEEAAELIDRYYERSDGTHRSRRVAQASSYAALPMLAQGLQVIDPGASTAEQAPDLSTIVPDDFDPPSVQTGHPLLDALNGPERLQVLGWAREQQNKRTTQIKGSMDVAINNAVASISTGEYAGPQLTEEQVLRVYGPLEGPQKWAEYEGSLQAGQVVQRIKTLNPAEMQQELRRLTPDPASESYATEIKLFEAAQRAVASVQQQRSDDPAAYVFQAFPEIATRLQNAETSEQRQTAYAEVGRAMERMGIPERERVFFTKEMLEEATTQYRTSDARGKLGIIESWISEMGAENAGRTLGRVGGTEAAQDLAIYATIRRTPNYQQTFLDVMRGREIIAKDPARKPSFDAINKAFSTGISSAINNLSPEFSRSVNEAAGALYVQRGGTTGAQGILSDPNLYTQALTEVLGGGGAADMTRGEVTDFTILPPNTTRQSFENWIERLRPGDLTNLSPRRKPPVDRSGRPLSLETIIDEGVFVMVAPGMYGIKLGSDGKWVGDSSGQKFLMQLRFR